MPTAASFVGSAAERGARARRVLPALLLGLALLPGCTDLSPSGPAAPTAAAPALPPLLPFDEAVLNAANRVFAGAPAPSGGQPVVIDPLVDGVTGEQSAATRQIGTRIASLAQERFPQFRVARFTPEAVAQRPFVVVGTFTPVNARNQPAGDREAFRFCLVMADLRTGRIVSKAVARAQLQGVDATRTAFFRDSPAWRQDPAVKSYIDTCQATQVGSPIPPAYVDGIVTASVVAEAIEAYDAGRFREALDLYRTAATAPAGNQLRVHNGIYLANWKLNRRAEATEAFGRLVDFGLTSDQLAVMLLFRPGSTAFLQDPRISGQYDMWLRQIATRAAGRGSCLQVTGHTSKSGSPAVNERLSQLRAEYVKDRLQREAPALDGRVIAAGAGSNQVLIGTGADDASDALDRRVDFRMVPNC